MEDQAVEVVGEISQSEFRLGPLEANRAYEQTEPVFLMRKHMLNPGPDRGLCRIRASGGLGHGLSLGLAAVDATGQHAIGQPCFVGPGTVCCVGPNLAAAIFCDHMAQHAPIGMSRRSDLMLARADADSRSGSQTAENLIRCCRHVEACDGGSDWGSI